MAASSCNRPKSEDTLICIGQNVRLSGSNLHMVADLFLSPDGTVCVAIHSSSGDASEIAQFISRMGFPGLNMIASDYFFKTEGQAASIADIMARYGHITYSESFSFLSIVSSKVSTPIIFFVGNMNLWPV